MKASLSLRGIKAVLPAVSTEETRYYLNGIHVEPSPAGGVLMVATDGHRLHAWHDVYGSIDKPAIVKIPTAVLKAKADRACTEARIVIDDLRVSLEGRTGASQPWEPQFAMVALAASDLIIEGTFPDWRRVVPALPDSTLPKSVPAFDPVYLIDFAAVAKAAVNADGQIRNKHSKPVTGTIRIVASDENSPALVRVADAPQFLGVLMPKRWSGGATFNRAPFAA